jgi:hypothetical protein
MKHGECPKLSGEFRSENSLKMRKLVVLHGYVATLDPRQPASPALGPADVAKLSG